MSTLHQFFLAFIPLFVAIDVLAVVPLYISLTEGFTEKRRQDTATGATLTAFIISILFLWTGKLMFSFLGITENDFRIGGGLLLLAISICDLLYSRLDIRRKGEFNAGAVPLGVPLIIGPAALTTILISVDTYGYPITLMALLINLLLVWLGLRQAPLVLKVIGRSGATAFARIMSIFLAAIGVMMIRAGITALIP